MPDCRKFGQYAPERELQSKECVELSGGSWSEELMAVWQKKKDNLVAVSGQMDTGGGVVLNRSLLPHLQLAGNEGFVLTAAHIVDKKKSILVGRYDKGGTMAARIKTVKSFIDCPFLIENTTFYLNVPGSTMTEAQFLSELLEQADCGLLLDVNNVYVNAFNHRLDPYKFFDQIPIERAVQVHMAGHKIKDDVVLDTHGAPIAEEVFDLLRYALSKTVINGITIERDQNIPAFAELADELSLLKAIAAGTNPDRRQ